MSKKNQPSKAKAMRRERGGAFGRDQDYRDMTSGTKRSGLSEKPPPCAFDENFVPVKAIPTKLQGQDRPFWMWSEREQLIYQGIIKPANQEG